MNQPPRQILIGQILIATCAALDLPAGDGVPDWVHLLPAAAGGVHTHDGRGPYRVTDAVAVINASLNGDPRDLRGLIIDENHASDLAAPKGGPRHHLVDV